MQLEANAVVVRSENNGTCPVARDATHEDIIDLSA
jgi:hypothetical protein